MTWARLRRSIAATVKAARHRFDDTKLYPATVTGQSADLERVDVRPDDSQVPAMAGVPLRLGLPGVRAKLRSHARVSIIIGFEEGQHARPFAALWSTEDVVESVVLRADQVVLGDDAGAEPPAKAHTLAIWLSQHVHGGVAAGPGVSGPPAVPPPPDIAASKVLVR
jgi:hypothetical protein